MSIVPIIRRQLFDDSQWTFELKFDGFGAIADTVNGRILSKRGNPMHRFETLLAALPADCVLDRENEIKALETECDATAVLRTKRAPSN